MDPRVKPAGDAREWVQRMMPNCEREPFLAFSGKDKPNDDPSFDPPHRSRGRRRVGRHRLPADGSRGPVRARGTPAGPRRYRDPRRQRVDHGREARRFRERRRPHPRRRHCRGRRKRQRIRRGGDRRSRPDLHAGLRRYPLAPLDQHAAALCPLRYRRAERFPGLHPARAAHDAAGCLCQRAGSASPRR